MRRILEVDLDNGRVVVEPGVTNIAVSQAVGPDALLPARPVQPDRLHDRRQRGRELRRRALLQVRLHDQLRDRARGRAAGRRAVHARRPRARPARATTCSARSSAPRARSASPRGSGCASSRSPRRCARSSPSSARPCRPARPSRRSSPAGIVPGAIEMMDNLSIQAAEGATDAGYPHGRGRRAGGRARRLRGRVRGALRAGGRRSASARAPTRVRVARDEAERELIWRARKAAFAAMGRIAPNYYVQDSVIPRTRLAEVLGADRRARDEHGLRVANVFHAGDGNLHPLVCYDGAQAGRGRARRGARRADRQGVRRRGRLDHRRARRRRRQEALHAGDVRRARPGGVPAAALRVRPGRLANPGKVMPTPRLCGEVPGPVPAAPARGGRAGGALLMAVARRARATREALAAALAAAGEAGTPVRFRGGGHEARLGPAAPRDAIELSTRGLDRDRRAQRRRPDRRARGGRAAGARPGDVRRGRPDARARPARATGATIGGVVATRRLRPAAPPLRRRRATWWSGCASRSPTAPSRRAAAR